MRSSDLPPEWQRAHSPCRIPIPESFWSPKCLVIADRAHCETDPTLQQLLPYIVLMDETGRVYCYERGAGGAESRLHAKLSIGLGGHVDEVPGYGLSLRDWMEREAWRELAEEVGLVSSPNLTFKTFLVDRSNPVGAVHLGLLAVARVHHTDIESLEADTISKGGWRTVRDLCANDMARLEPWSQLALHSLIRVDTFERESDLEFVA